MKESVYKNPQTAQALSMMFPNLPSLDLIAAAEVQREADMRSSAM